jgi:uncharacterized OB-fold protein
MMNFVAYTCTKCDSMYTQKKYLCPNCRYDTFFEKEVSGKGKVYTYTTIHISSPNYQHLAPYNVVLVELENGLKLTGRMKDEVDIEDLVELQKKSEGAFIFQKI